MNFVKKIFEDRIDKQVHSKFIRFGKGEYKRRFIVSLWKAKKIKIKTSFEFANDLVGLVLNLNENTKFSGVILSKENLGEFFAEKDREVLESKSKGIYVYNVEEIEGEIVRELLDNVYYLLLDADSKGIKLRIKKKLPKPGKEEGKIDDKFCQLEADEKFYSKMKEEFFWDIPEGKKILFSHKVIIDKIVIPQGEEDFAKIRELSKRKGKIIREGEVDGKEIKMEIEFEA